MYSLNWRRRNKNPQAIFCPKPSIHWRCNPVFIKRTADWIGNEEKRRISRLEKGNAKGKIVIRENTGKEKNKNIEDRISKLKKDQNAAKKSINSEKRKSKNPKDIEESSWRVKTPIFDSRITSFNHKVKTENKSIPTIKEFITKINKVERKWTYIQINNKRLPSISDVEKQ